MENKKLIIIGAGGFASVVAEAALLKGFDVVGFADDNLPLNTKIYKNLVVISTISELENNNKVVAFDCFIVAIGNNKIRKQIYEKLIIHYQTPTIIHPKATVSELIEIKKGNVILAGAVINANCIVGENNIINSLVLIDHNSQIGSHCHIAQGTIVGSNAKIGNEYLSKLGQHLNSFSELA